MAPWQRFCSKLKVFSWASPQTTIAPLATNVEACGPVHGVAQKAELDGARRGAISLKEPTPCHHEGGQDRPVRYPHPRQIL